MGRQTQIWPKCETCGDLATCAVQDTLETRPAKDASGQHWQTFKPDGELHWFCKAHKRASRTRNLTNRERCEAVAG